MEYINKFTQLAQDNINFNEKYFIQCAQITLFNGALWCILPYLQYKFKLISRLVDNNMAIAADFLAFLLINIGSARNTAFMDAVSHNEILNFGDAFNTLTWIIGAIWVVLGFIFILGSFYRLGLRGMYFGDHFGFLFKERIEKFPYNVLDNPQYVGANLFYLGLSLIYRSPTGVFLTFLVMFSYNILYYFFERYRVKEFYPETPQTQSKKKN